MADYPLLVLPPPEVAGKRSKLVGGGANVQGPGPARQAERLDPRLDALAEQFEKRAIALRTEATGVEPEAVIVLEIVGSVDDFAKAVREIPDLEWLGEEVLESPIDPDDDFFLIQDAERKDKPLPRRLFMVFSNQQAFTQILSLWKRYKDGKTFRRGFAKWRAVFEQLHDIRPWGARDRIAETGVLEAWRELLPNAGTVKCELELWHRTDPKRRREARNRVEGAVARESGTIKARCEIPEIAYNALIAELPRRAVARVLQDPKAAEEIELLQYQDLQFIRHWRNRSRAAKLPRRERRSRSIKPSQPESPYQRCLMACLCKITKCYAGA